MPKSQPRKSSRGMVILLGAASHKDRKTVARPSRSPHPIATTVPQLLRASRPIHLKMQHGKCKAQFAMYLGLADTPTRQAPMLKPDLILDLRPPHITATVTAAPATVANQQRARLKANRQASHIGRVQAQVRWALLARLLLPFLHSCNTVILTIRPRLASIRLIHSLWGVFVSWDLLSVLSLSLFLSRELADGVLFLFLPLQIPQK
jgi:hypothetical protein